jgi:hypothetical protein
MVDPAPGRKPKEQTIFLVHREQTGPQWLPGRPLEEQTGWLAHAAYMDELVDGGIIVLGGPLDEPRVALAIEAESAGAVEAILDRDPWTGTHLVTTAIDRWTIRLDARKAGS